MGLVHKLSEFFDIAVFQGCHRIDGALVFIYGVFCAFQLDGIADEGLICLEFFRRQVAESVDIEPGLQCGKRFRTFAAPVIIGGIHQAVLYFTVS